MSDIVFHELETGNIKVRIDDWTGISIAVKNGQFNGLFDGDAMRRHYLAILTLEARTFFEDLGYKHDADAILDLRLGGIVMSKKQALEFKLRFL